ncbi:tRNA uridine(34) 5-carboxymethylaminomethyl modification radical SAM/GNAT enzyme Elp3 [Candidatus Peregrinibacteria bacterium]|nr:tRNA uridine(34) 5-carboxymethylaminomethyl modification radical SAM/GNAT enzyme Elp3 [Candidatus Peregrinibacteria bacterium]
MSLYSVRKSLLPLSRKIILELCGEKVLDEKKLKEIRNRLTEINGGILPRNLELIQAYRELLEKGKIENAPSVLKIIQKRKVRSLSGIANITVLTKELGCPGQCIFCPTEKGMPKSYLSSEPAMMRAVMNDFDACRQVSARLNGLVAQGHDVSKIDIRIAGGTWGSIPEGYRLEFLCGIFRALNQGPTTKNPKSKARNTKKNSKCEIRNSKLHLAELIKNNEKAKCRCVGLWVETRPDWVTEEEIRKLRSYGVTGVELGIQTTDDKVNQFCRRGHGLKESIRATQLLRDAGLKVCHHLMPNLPTATFESDLKSGLDLFENEGLRPDYLKIYPMVVTPFSPLAAMVKKDPDIHKAYSDEELMNLLALIKKQIPEYCRVIRVIRDIPAESILMGSKKSNLRQMMQVNGVECRCVRCREIQDSKFRIQDTELRTQRYRANGGEEVFISIDEPKLDKIIGLCRLRLPGKNTKPIFKVLENSAIVRELHIYGRQEALDKKRSIDSKTQHLGFGKKLMNEAEKIAKRAGYSKIAVIAAIGTREYYRKLGYKLKETYMIKILNPKL